MALGPHGATTAGLLQLLWKQVLQQADVSKAQLAVPSQAVQQVACTGAQGKPAYPGYNQAMLYMRAG